ncbi:MAG: type II toxin-antitoxin system RelE family toxin [Acidimicrobiales bacterium]
MSHYVTVARRAERDLRGLGTTDLARIRSAVIGLARGAQGDVKALAGSPPWLRMRAGDYRILFRPLTAAELGREEPAGWLIARVVHRSELERAVRGL